MLGITGALAGAAAPVLPRRLPFERRRGRRARLVALAARRRLDRRAAARRAPRRGRAGTRRRARRAPPSGAIVCAVASLVWLVNPYAAALLLPAAHLWLLAGAPRRGCAARWAGRARRRAARAGARARRLDGRAATSARSSSRGCGSSRPPAGTSRLGGARARRALRLRRGALRVLRARRRIAAATPAERPRDARPGDLRRAGIARRHGVRAAAMTRARCCAPLDRADRRGALLLADAAATLVWQEPLVGALRELQQASSTTSWRARARGAARRPARAARGCRDPRRRLASAPARCARRRTRATRSAASQIPTIGLETVVVEGTGRAATCARVRATTRTRRCPAQRGTVGDRRPPHDLRRAVPQARRARARRPDRARDALRPLRVPRGAHAHRRADGDWVTVRAWLRPARAVRLPSAVLRRRADRRVRPPRALSRSSDPMAERSDRLPMRRSCVA